jgi:hypothetical protein
LNSQLAHVQPVRCLREVALARFVRRAGGRHQHDFFVACDLCDGARTDQVPVVNRIETSAQAQRFHMDEVYDFLTADSDAVVETTSRTDRNTKNRPATT